MDEGALLKRGCKTASETVSGSTVVVAERIWARKGMSPKDFFQDASYWYVILNLILTLGAEETNCSKARARPPFHGSMEATGTRTGARASGKCLNGYVLFFPLKALIDYL
eukprot:1152628-Pelagomonas_calceolata.AAC.3